MLSHNDTITAKYIEKILFTFLTFAKASTGQYVFDKSPYVPALASGFSQAAIQTLFRMLLIQHARWKKIPTDEQLPSIQQASAKVEVAAFFMECMSSTLWWIVTYRITRLGNFKSDQLSFWSFGANFIAIIVNYLLSAAIAAGFLKKCLGVNTENQPIFFWQLQNFISGVGDDEGFWWDQPLNIKAFSAAGQRDVLGAATFATIGYVIASFVFVPFIERISCCKQSTQRYVKLLTNFGITGNDEKADLPVQPQPAVYGAVLGAQSP